MDTEDRRRLLRRAAVVGAGAGAGMAASVAPAGAASPDVLRRKTDAGWSRSNPVLRAGEPGWATDSCTLKIGDGRSRWSELPAYIDEKRLADRLDQRIADAIADFVDSEAFDQACAARIGAAIVVSDQAPADTTRYGLPVVWIDSSAALDPIPAQPAAPTFDDAKASYTIPAGVVGVDYLVDGEVRTQGRTYQVSSVPGSVQVTARARPGYALLGDYTFDHDFPDVTRMTVLTSDSFAGPAGPLAGRTTDCAHGGSPAVWVDQQAGTSAGVLSGNGRLGHGADAGAVSQLEFPGTHNFQVEFDLSAIGNGGRANDTPLIVGVAGRGVSVQMGQTRTRIQCESYSGGNVDLLFGVGVPSPTGHWTLRLYDRTFTVTDGNGKVRQWHLDKDSFNSGAADAGGTVYVRNQAASGQRWALDNLVVKQIGF